MGKTKLLLKAENYGLKRTLEFLLSETGYFDLVSESYLDESEQEDKDLLLVKIEDEELLSKPFSSFLAEILGRAKIKKRSEISIGDIKTKVISAASLSDEVQTDAFLLNLSEKLFQEGFRSVYLTLKPLNQGIRIFENKEKCFSRWMLDSRSGNMGPLEKYIFDSGETLFVGTPSFNPSAGDVGIGDVINLLKMLAESRVDYLLIDIGTHLDLERRKIFMMSDCPIIFHSEFEADQEIINAYFSDAIKLDLLGNEGEYYMKAFEELQKGGREKYEEHTIWN